MTPDKQSETPLTDRVTFTPITFSPQFYLDKKFVFASDCESIERQLISAKDVISLYEQGGKINDILSKIALESTSKLKEELTSLKKDIEALPCINGLHCGTMLCGLCPVCQLKQKINK